jgi:S1-C subfamily serine protease
VDDIILTIDGAEVNDIAALKAKLNSLRETKPRSVVFGIRREPRTYFLEIEPRW